MNVVGTSPLRRVDAVECEAGSAAEVWAVLREPAATYVLLAGRDLGAPPGEPGGIVIAAEAHLSHGADRNRRQWFLEEEASA